MQSASVGLLGYLPAERADDCADKYEQLNYAFDKQAAHQSGIGKADL
jgi:hypothetical protein